MHGLYFSTLAASIDSIHVIHTWKTLFRYKTLKGLYSFSTKSLSSHLQPQLSQHTCYILEKTFSGLKCLRVIRPKSNYLLQMNATFLLSCSQQVFKKTFVFFCLPKPFSIRCILLTFTLTFTENWVGKQCFFVLILTTT